MHAELNVNMKMSDHIRNVNIILNKMVTGSSMQEKATLSPLLPPCQKYYIHIIAFYVGQIFHHLHVAVPHVHSFPNKMLRKKTRFLVNDPIKLII